MIEPTDHFSLWNIFSSSPTHKCVFSYDCHLNWYSNLGHVMVAYYVSMTAHTIYYWSAKDRFVYGTRCLCGMGIMISSVPLYWKSIGEDGFKFHNILNFAGDHIYESSTGSGAYSEVCEQGAHKMLKAYGILTCVICTSMSLVSLGPMLILFRYGVWTTPLGTQFPYADQSDIALYLDFIIQLLIALIGILTTVSIELSQIILNNVVEITADVIKLNIDQFAEQLKKIRDMRSYSSAHFRNILLQIQDFDRFLDDFRDVFYWRTFVGPYALAFATAYAFFAQFVLDFPAGYGSACASYIQLLILCYMGQNVRSANDLIYDALAETPWYYMPLTKQKDLSHLLLRMQNGMSLTMGPFDELNYDKASTMTKGIYQFSMALIQFTG